MTKCPDCGDDCIGCVSAEYAMFESEDGLCATGRITFIRWLLYRIGWKKWVKNQHGIW
jgi:hypothetical protein